VGLFPDNGDWNIVEATVSATDVAITMPANVVHNGRGVLLLTPATNIKDVRYGPVSGSSGSPLTLAPGSRETFSLFIDNLNRIEFQTNDVSGAGVDKLIAVFEQDAPLDIST
jgi:hypothetical protein